MSHPSPEPSGIPTLRTATARLLLPPSADPTPPGVDAFVPAASRDHQPEILRTAALCALWTFAATGCFLPWGGHGWLLLARTAALLALWVPLWFLALVLTIVIPGGLCLLLHRRGLLSSQETITLSTALCLLFFSIIALILARSPLLPAQIIGWLWLIALVTESLLRIVHLFVKKRT